MLSIGKHSQLQLLLLGSNKAVFHHFENLQHILAFSTTVLLHMLLTNQQLLHD